MNLEEKLILLKERGYTYDSITGFMFYPDGRKVDKKNKGYIVFTTSYNKKTFSIKVHQFAWYITYNKIPTAIDHINRIKTDNRISNLRLLTQKENTLNRFGDGFSKRTSGRFTSRIRINKRLIYLGTYNTKEEAREAYLNAKKEYHIIG